jgi:hypothetical protein
MPRPPRYIRIGSQKVVLPPVDLVWRQNIGVKTFFNPGAPGRFLTVFPAIFAPYIG